MTRKAATWEQLQKKHLFLVGSDFTLHKVGTEQV